MVANRQHGEGPRRDAGAAALPLKGVLLSLLLVSVLLNLLALNGPLFMLQVYDRVLASGSLPTLMALCVLAAGLFGFQALLDALRARILLRLGEGFDLRFSAAVLRSIMRLPLMTRASGDGQQPLRDLDAVRVFLAGPGPGAFLDLPWMPVYIGICFLFHFWIGVTALAGTIIMVALTLITDLSARRPARQAMEQGLLRAGLTENARRSAETIRAMGMERAIAGRWRDINGSYLAAGRTSGDLAGSMSGLSRAVRQGLQSAILAVGAFLVIEQQASAGVMIAASIMMGRAMAPVDSAIGQWKAFVAARQGWARLKKLMPSFIDDQTRLALPTPAQELRAENLTIVPPGAQTPTILDISFRLTAGSALGIIGPSGSGKSTLARALTGVWRPSRGHVRLDGAALDQWDPDDLGRHIGYLPQSPEMFEGTIADNIARLQPDAAAETIVAAARAAGAHDFITSLPLGYQTPIGQDGSGLSGGQRQRIGLARALFGAPFLLVLDEPNANLDAEGEAAVIRAIAHQRERSGIAIVIAHRPSAISAVDMVMVMEAGRARAFGPRDAVLEQVIKTAGAGTSGARMVNPLRVVVNQDATMADPEVGRSTEPGHD
ncbi:type I secretion system permease/ATPase [Devosia alba]|uniref:type I secretion system permease/ATPase n=1 Tax=Devosia alba TaxID=3152360 RepID=UPI0032636108